MTIDFAVPLITGLFVGGIITEVRWVLRLRQFQGEIGLNRSAETQKAAAFAQIGDREPAEAQFSLDLRTLHGHVAAQGGTAPALEPARVETRNA